MAQTAQLRRIDRPENEAQRIFQLQREAYLAHPYPSLEERRQRLRALERVLLENRDGIADAIHRDFGHRCTEESLMLELFTCVAGIRHTLKKLPRWIRPQRRSVSLTLRHGPQPAGAAAEGRGGHRLALELPALPHGEPAHQRARRGKPRHAQDGEPFAERSAGSSTRSSAQCSPRTWWRSSRASPPAISRRCPSIICSSPAPPTPVAP